MLNRRAVLSGFMGASASCVAKLALDTHSPIAYATSRFCQENQQLIHSVPLQHILPDDLCLAADILARGVFLLLVVGLNALMMGTFLDGMNESGSVAATALSTAANFSVSVSQSFISIVQLLFHL